MSLVPEQDATAEQILTHMCARCHNGNLEQSLSRARFDATRLSELDDAQKAVIADRIQRHEDDKLYMPPRRSGTMPQWAVTGVLDDLGQSLRIENERRPADSTRRGVVGTRARIRPG